MRTCTSVSCTKYAPIKKVDAAKRLVTGVVLEPKTVDLQGDVITADEIRKAMERYMEKSQKIGRQHESCARASVVECYIANSDFLLDGKESVRKGSWVLTVKVHDDNIWRDIVSGKLTGFSVGGKGVRTG